jgi:hypothetical protein
LRKDSVGSASITTPAAHRRYASPRGSTSLPDERLAAMPRTFCASGGSLVLLGFTTTSKAV